MSRRQSSWLHRLLAPLRAGRKTEPPDDNRPWTIFLVTGDGNVHDEFTALGTRLGHQVLSFDDLPSARAQLRRGPPDLAVVDWRFVGNGGLKTIDELRQSDHAPGLPIMALVTDGSTETLADLIGHGIDDYLVLPLDERGTEIRLLLLMSRCKATRQLSRSNRSLRSDFDRFLIASGGQADGVWDWNVASNTVYYSSRWKEMLGFSDSEIADSPDEWFDRVYPDDRERLRALIETTVAGNITPLEHRYRMKCKNGRHRWMLTRADVIRNKRGKVVRVVGRQTDIHEEEASDEDLRVGGLHDPLTRLPNRTVLMDRLRLAFARAQRDPGRPFAVLFFDVDRFKNVNDSLGHLTGDKLLRSIADRVQHACRPSDTVARFGGDEFVIIVENIADVRGAIAAAERIQEEFKIPFEVDGLEVFSTISIGIALWNPAYPRPEDLLRDSDTAMYRAKAMGRNNFAVFDEKMHARVVATLKLETDLRRALARKQFRPYFQPIVSIQEGRIMGFEALVRWQHPERGLLLPGEFIQVAEEMGAIIQIDRFIAEEACRQLHLWQNEYRHEPPLTVSVNVSGTQFMQPDLVTQIDHILRKTGVYGKSLTLEVTESVLMENAQYAVEMLEQLRALDIGISIDDFGTGYSSLAYLRRFKIDTLKIDYSFVSRMLADEENSEIVRTITTLALNLGKQTVAEGVETRSQFEALQELNVDAVQGWFISPPLPAEAAEKLLNQTAAEHDHLKKILHDRMHSSAG